MNLYIIVGRNGLFNNTSARAAYSRREDAEAHLKDKDRMWFDDQAVIVELTLDKELAPRSERHLQGA